MSRRVVRRTAATVTAGAAVVDEAFRREVLAEALAECLVREIRGGLDASAQTRASCNRNGETEVRDVERAGRVITLRLPRDAARALTRLAHADDRPLGSFLRQHLMVVARTAPPENGTAPPEKADASAH